MKYEKKKSRKPSFLNLGDIVFEVERPNVRFIIYLNKRDYISFGVSLRLLKRLHKWLGRAIAYLEQEKLKAARGG